MNRKLLFIATVSLMLAACENESVTVRAKVAPHCTLPADRERVAVFVVDCAKAANPMSDEEGEDLVRQCQRTGEEILCPIHRHEITYRGFHEDSWKETAP